MPHRTRLRCLLKARSAGHGLAKVTQGGDPFKSHRCRLAAFQSSALNLLDFVAHLALLIALHTQWALINAGDSKTIFQLGRLGEVRGDTWVLLMGLGAAYATSTACARSAGGMCEKS